MADRGDRVLHGYTYYLDGAGGGTAKKNWASGVVEGVLAAGYHGAGEMFSWETGRGLIADQDASVKSKRAKAKELAASIAERAAAYPGVPLNLLGFSAGTAVAIFTLEYLPESVQVDRVVLLGTSISEDYDLTKALKRVKERLYIYTSQHDHMLGTLMPLSGTADRKYHDPGAGITGFVLPHGATAETRMLYAEKISTIRWSPEMKLVGDDGHHFDNVKPEFIQQYVAPLLKSTAEPAPGLKPPDTGALAGTAAPGTPPAYGPIGDRSNGNRSTGAAAEAGTAGALNPPSAAAAAPLANEQIVMHTVADGDSLWTLSRQYGTSVQRIKEVNMMTSDDIFAGKSIKIPTTKPPAEATTPPSATTPGVRPASASAPAPASVSIPGPVRTEIPVPRD